MPQHAAAERRRRASSASYLVAEWATGLVVPGEGAEFAARGLLALILLAVTGVTLKRSAERAEDILRQLFVIAAAIYLLLPSQFAWYFVWIAPFLCLFRVRGLLLASALVPFHYLYFYFDARDLKHIYINGVVWLIWLPVWGLLVYDLVRHRFRHARP